MDINVKVTFDFSEGLFNLFKAIQLFKPAQIELEPKQTAPKVTAQSKEVTPEDVRKAIDEVRVRIIGADWESGTSEAYAKYYKPLNAMLKTMSIPYGSNKPSTIPADKRAAFIAELKYVTIDENGELIQNVPF